MVWCSEHHHNILFNSFSLIHLHILNFKPIISTISINPLRKRFQTEIRDLSTYLFGPKQIRAFNPLSRSRFLSCLNTNFLSRLWTPSPQLTPPNPHCSPWRLPEEICLYPAAAAVNAVQRVHWVRLSLFSPFLF